MVLLDIALSGFEERGQIILTAGEGSLDAILDKDFEREQDTTEVDASAFNQKRGAKRDDLPNGLRSITIFKVRDTIHQRDQVRWHSDADLLIDRSSIHNKSHWLWDLVRLSQ
ncbi:hypothetical protein [Novosphingobium mathurense]|uniref:hypothetical protein n=1 Tax=Novosphingobium mathurense TaxID=428990 RepID=UPI0009A67941|nr:hypothetical protein [Novosphingobium mathurense]